MKITERAERAFDSAADCASEWLGAPLFFVLALFGCFVWLITGPIFNWSNTWQLIINTATTVITFLMIFLVQSSQNKDTKTIHAKLDQILKDLPQVDDNLAGIEKESYEARKV